MLPDGALHHRVQRLHRDLAQAGQRQAAGISDREFEHEVPPGRAVARGKLRARRGQRPRVDPFAVEDLAGGRLHTRVGQHHAVAAGRQRILAQRFHDLVPDPVWLGGIGAEEPQADRPAIAAIGIDNHHRGTCGDLAEPHAGAEFEGEQFVGGLWQRGGLGGTVVDLGPGDGIDGAAEQHAVHHRRRPGAEGEVDPPALATAERHLGRLGSHRHAALHVGDPHDIPTGKESGERKSPGGVGDSRLLTGVVHAIRIRVEIHDDVFRRPVLTPFVCEYLALDRAGPIPAERGQRGRRSDRGRHEGERVGQRRGHPAGRGERRRHVHAVVAGGQPSLRGQEERAARGRPPAEEFAGGGADEKAPGEFLGGLGFARIPNAVEVEVFVDQSLNRRTILGIDLGIPEDLGAAVGGSGSGRIAAMNRRHDRPALPAVVFIVPIADAGGATVDGVGPAAGIDPVVTGAALDPVIEVTIAAVHDVVAITGEDRGRAGGKNCIAAGTAQQVVVGPAPLDIVALEAAADVIAAERAVDRVIAIATDQHRGEERAAAGGVATEFGPEPGGIDHQPVAGQRRERAGADVDGRVGRRRGAARRLAVGIDDVVARPAVDVIEAEPPLDQIGIDVNPAAVVGAGAQILDRAQPILAPEEIIAITAVDLVVAAAPLHDVVTLARIDRVVAAAGIDRVVAGAAEDHVAVVATGDRVVARDAAAEAVRGPGEVTRLVVAEQLISAGVPRDRVVAAVAVDDVVGPIPQERVVGTTAQDLVAAGGAGHAPAVAVEGVAARSAGQLVVARTAVARDADPRRNRVGEENDVVAQAGIERNLADARRRESGPAPLLVLVDRAVSVEVGLDVVGPHDDLVAVGVVVDLENLVAVGRLAGQHEAGPRPGVEHERASHVLGHRRRHRRAGDQFPIEKSGPQQFEAVLPEGDEADEGHRQAHLDGCLEEGVDRSLQVEDTLRSAAEVREQFVEVHPAVVVQILEVGPQDPLHAPRHPGLGDHHVELRARADGGGEGQLRLVAAIRVDVTEIDAVEDLGGPHRLRRHRLADAAGVVAEREVGGELEAAEEPGEQRREDRDALVEREAGHEVGHVPFDERRVFAEQQRQERVGRILEQREGDRAVRHGRVGIGGRAARSGRRGRDAVPGREAGVARFDRPACEGIAECRRRSVAAGARGQRQAAERNPARFPQAAERVDHVGHAVHRLDEGHRPVVVAASHGPDDIEHGDRPAAKQLRDVGEHRHLTGEQIEHRSDRLDEPVDRHENFLERPREEPAEIDEGVGDLEEEPVGVEIGQGHRSAAGSRQIVEAHRERHADPWAAEPRKDLGGKVGGDFGPHLAADVDRGEQIGEFGEPIRIAAKVDREVGPEFRQGRRAFVGKDQRAKLQREGLGQVEVDAGGEFGVGIGLDEEAPHQAGAEAEIEHEGRGEIDRGIAHDLEAEGIDAEVDLAARQRCRRGRGHVEIDDQFQVVAEQVLEAVLVIEAEGRQRTRRARPGEELVEVLILLHPVGRGGLRLQPGVAQPVELA